MARSGKWLTGVGAADPVAEAARLALSSRLDVLKHYLPLAAKKSHQDLEYVHQLRVASRRARAALDMFEPLLPPRKSRWLKRWLRRIRRKAGDARDLDVMQQQLTRQVRNGDPAMVSVLCDVERRRRRAQRPLRRLHRRVKKKEFFERAERIIQRIKPRRETSAIASFGQFGAGALRASVEDWFAHADRLDVADVESLHALRISAKHLRYTMELVAPAFDPSLRNDLYPAVAALQDDLGAINDHYCLAALLEKSAHETANGAWRERLQELYLAQCDAADEARRRFARTWHSEQEKVLRRRLAQFSTPTRDRKTA